MLSRGVDISPPDNDNVDNAAPRRQRVTRSNEVATIHTSRYLLHNLHLLMLDFEEGHIDGQSERGDGVKKGL